MSVTAYKLAVYSDSASRWTCDFDLSDTRYKFYIAWNTRAELWELSIFDNSGNVVVGGIAMREGFDLLDEYRNFILTLPPGQIQVVRNNDRVKELNRDNLASDFDLVYYEP